jgi:hypothetical protein
LPQNVEDLTVSQKAKPGPNILYLCGAKILPRGRFDHAIASIAHGVNPAVERIRLIV